VSNLILKPNLPPCTRCQGRMILDSESGDASCFSCGNVVYALAPMDRLRRRTSHGGQNLS
jgi:hypothetical protein